MSKILWDLKNSVKEGENLAGVLALPTEAQFAGGKFFRGPICLELPLNNEN